MLCMRAVNVKLLQYSCMYTGYFHSLQHKFLRRTEGHGFMFCPITIICAKRLRTIPSKNYDRLKTTRECGIF
jgi:hypothetical protein